MSPTTPTGLSRRRVIACAGVLCAAGTAGCATYGPGGPHPSADGSAAGPVPPTPGQAPTPAAPSGLAGTAEIPLGSGRVFADHGVVVTQPHPGTFAAFGLTCPHQGCQVNEVTDGGISCPCHGSRFDLTDGAPTAGPAKAPLERRQISVEGDRVVLA